MGIRSPEIGTDTKNYIHEYLSGTGGYFREVGFRYLGYIIFKLGLSYKYYLTIISIINTFLYYIGFKLLIKNTQKFYLIMWIFLFNITYLFGSVNILRQSIAGGFLLISFSFLQKRKKVLAFSLILLGMTFHITIIFFLPIIYVYKLYFSMTNKKKYIILVLIFILSFLIIKILLFHPKFYNYFYFMKTNKSFYLKFLLLIITYILYSQMKIKKIFYEFLMYYGLCLLIIFINFGLLPSRCIYYVNIYIPITVVEILEYKIKNRKIIYILLWLYHIFILFYPSTIDMFKWKV